MRWVAGLALLMAGCAQPSRVSGKIEIKGDIVRVELRNEANRATTPLLVKVMVGGRAVVHPAGFVLKPGEIETISARLHEPTGGMPVRLSVTEQETGREILSQSIAGPEIPPPPGK